MSSMREEPNQIPSPQLPFSLAKLFTFITRSQLSLRSTRLAPLLHVFLLRQAHQLEA